MSRFQKRQAEIARGKPVTQWEKNQELLAKGPRQRPDGRWEGCRHYVPGAPYGCVGPGPHNHEGKP
jgi:hypothetical protein